MVQIYSGRPCQIQASSEQLTRLLRAPRAGFAAQCLTYCSFLEPKALKTHRALSHHAGCEAGPVELGFCTVPHSSRASLSLVAPKSKDKHLLLDIPQLDLVTAFKRNNLCCGCRGSTRVHCQQYSDTALKKLTLTWL